MGRARSVVAGLGALLALARTWPDRIVGIVLAFGAGALISAVSFDLAAEGVRLGGADPVALGLAAGAVTYFLPTGASTGRPSAGRARVGER